ncbi:MAG: type I methionyl aminopeptidase [Clostridiales bacterium]|nr:type I methionyl aminopeptidase [Clostridiales bacterium]
MIVKTDQERNGMRAASRVVKAALDAAERFIKPGVTTLEIDAVVEETIRSFGATPSSKGYQGYPNASCISVNDVVVHGIPSLMTVKDGDIVSVDITALLNGYQGDAARTFPVGNVSPQNLALIAAAKAAFEAGIEYAKAGGKVGDISSAVQLYTELRGYGVVRALTGHGIGHKMHEPPEVPNFGKRNTGAPLKNGMCICIEPMITAGDWRVVIDRDGWTVRTADKSNAAHYENTVIITGGEPEILTV